MVSQTQVSARWWGKIDILSFLFNAAEGCQHDMCVQVNSYTLPATREFTHNHTQTRSNHSVARKVEEKHSYLPSIRSPSRGLIADVGIVYERAFNRGADARRPGACGRHGGSDVVGARDCVPSSATPRQEFSCTPLQVPR